MFFKSCKWDKNIKWKIVGDSFSVIGYYSHKVKTLKKNEGLKKKSYKIRVSSIMLPFYQLSIVYVVWISWAWFCTGYLNIRFSKT